MFSKKQRIPRESIKKVISEGQKNRSESFLFYKKENEIKFDRFAVIVSKKKSKTAVERHKIKRLVKNSLKEVFNNQLKNKEIIKKHQDVVVVVASKIKEIKYKNISDEVNKKSNFLLG